MRLFYVFLFGGGGGVLRQVVVEVGDLGAELYRFGWLGLLMLTC